jgi:hypothetical protein
MYGHIRIRVMVFISWQSVLLVEETGVPREKPQGPSHQRPPLVSAQISDALRWLIANKLSLSREVTPNIR